jgi:hypothetical protein
MFQRNVGYDAYESVDPRDWKLRLDMPVLVGATHSLSPYAQWNMEIAHREYVVDGFEYLPRHILMRFSSLVVSTLIIAFNTLQNLVANAL